MGGEGIQAAVPMMVHSGVHLEGGGAEGGGEGIEQVREMIGRWVGG